MSVLVIYPQQGGEPDEVLNDHAAIAARLGSIGVQFERWQADSPLAPDAGQQAILDAYRIPVQRLKQQYDFQSADVIAVQPSHPDRAALRAKFRAEHIHSDFEVRFFVDGQGLFYLHPDDKVYAVLCGRGDLISVPAGVAHWFDMGEVPSLKCIRLFTTPEGWVAQFTGSVIGESFPDMAQFTARYP